MYNVSNIVFFHFADQFMKVKIGTQFIYFADNYVLFE